MLTKKNFKELLEEGKYSPNYTLGMIEAITNNNLKPKQKIQELKELLEVWQEQYKELEVGE